MPNSRPTLTGLTTAVTFEEQLVNTGSLRIDNFVTFGDLDANFTGATFTVSGALAEDTVAIFNDGTSSGEIGVSGANVTYGGVTIGTFTGGTAGAQLVVTFNASADVAGINQLLESITYANSSNTPTASRDLIFSFNDAAGASLRSPLAFAQLTGVSNPFNGLDVGSVSAPALADLDGDGDLDMLSGNTSGTFNYYRNTGTAIAPTYVVQTGGSNPFDGLTVSNDSTPSFADLDGDGDYDAVVGSSYGTLRYFRNTGTVTAPAFTEQTGVNNPFDGVDIGGFSIPALADLDGDGDQDALIGESDGTLNYYRNTGTATAPAYTVQTGVNNPFNAVDIGVYSAPSFADIDGDGDFDVVIGSNTGTFKLFENTGSAVAPTFVERTGALNPFDGVSLTSGYNTPSLADIDGDGDFDLVSGASNGQFFYFRNNEPATAMASFTQVSGAGNPFNGVAVNTFSKPAMADLDGDGDMDALVGNYAGTLRYYRNTGTAVAPVYAEQTGVNSPFDGVDIGRDSAPVFGDLDGDGDLDAVIGEYGGTLLYYRNTSTATTAVPVFSQQTGVNNPFNGIDVGTGALPTLADLDGDGDLDALIGEQDGTLNYYLNTGTASAPVYVVQTGVNNPFNGVDVGAYSGPAFADLDGDGDLDAVLGAVDGLLRTFRNTGSATSPVFAELTGAANPFNGVDVTTYSMPSFADVDGDGDQDLLVGRNTSDLVYFRNNGSGFAVTVNVTAQNENPFTGGNDTLDLGTLNLSAYHVGDVTNALGGNDVVTLSSTQNLGVAFNAGLGTDSITGGSGADLIFGGEDNDTINGGGGTDTAGFSGIRSIFHVVTTNVGGTLTTTVTAAIGTEGADTVTNTEVLRFQGIDFGFAGANLNLRGNTVGSRFDSVNFHNDSTGQSFVHIFANGARTGGGALTGANGAQWDAIDTADMNSDGIADIIYKNTADGSIAIGTSSAGGVTGYTFLTTALSTTWRLVGAADMDGDAYTDLIIQNNSTGFIYSADFTNLTFNAYNPVSNEGTAWQARALGDVNRDGIADIIYQNTTTTEVVAGLMTASSTISSYLPIATVGNWTVKEAADMNKDGYLDVLIQNNANGDISYANMAGGTFSGYGTVMNGFGTAWQLEGMADTNNDGDIDAVIRNVLGSSDTYVVNMEAGAFQSFTLVAQGIGSQWYVV